LKNRRKKNFHSHFAGLCSAAIGLLEQFRLFWSLPLVVLCSQVSCYVLLITWAPLNWPLKMC